MYTVYWQSLIIVFFQLPGKYKKSFHAENLLKNKKTKPGTGYLCTVGGVA